jgi:hypothetical protein
MSSFDSTKRLLPEILAEGMQTNVGRVTMPDRNSEDQFASLVSRGIAPTSVAIDGLLTKPRTWGVYEVGSGKRHRMGNHPVRHEELIRETASARLLYLYLSKSDAEAMKALLNGWSGSLTT